MRNISTNRSFHTGLKERSVNVCLCTVLSELDAELCEIFACGGEIVSDNWHILFNVHYNGCHIRTLVTNMLHTLPRHLEAEK